MDSIFELIDQIKNQPERYLGCRSLVYFKAFLDGWTWRSPVDPVDHEQFTGFQGWVEQKYHQPNTRSWDKIILFYSIDDHSALDTFFRLVDEYRKSLPPSFQPKPPSSDHGDPNSLARAAKFKRA
jgi:hypothetical protein